MALQVASGLVDDFALAAGKVDMEKQLFFSGPALAAWHDQMKKALPPGALLVTTAGTALNAWDDHMKKCKALSAQCEVLITMAGKDVTPYWRNRDETATAPPGEILKTLMTAKERLQKHGWAKTWQSDSGEICAGTAIGVGPVREMRQPHGEAALNEFCKTIGTTDFVRWNDAVGREFKDVMRALDQTIQATAKQLAESA